MIGLYPVAIPPSDGAISTQRGDTVVSVVVNNSSVPAADLLLYDNATTGSGNLIAVIPASGVNGTYPVHHQSTQGIYVKNTSGWHGTVWLNRSSV